MLEHDGSVKVTVNVRRDQGFADDITIDLESPPLGFSNAPITIVGGATSAELTLVASAAAKQGATELKVRGTANDKVVTEKVSVFVRAKPGGIDTTFGTDGVSAPAFSGTTGDVVELIVGSDALIYVVMRCMTTSGCAARFKLDGTLDTSYGGGSTTIPVALPSAAILDDQQRLVVAGETLGVYGLSGQFARVMPNGAVDVPGITTLGPFGGITAVAGCSDGSLYVVQHTGATLNVSHFLATGALDSAFGGGRFQMTWSYSGTLSRGLHCWQDNAVQVAGNWTDGLATTEVSKAGEVVTSFGPGGTSSTTPYPGTHIHAGLKVLPDGKEILAYSDPGSFTIARMYPNGGADLTFGTGDGRTRQSILGTLADLVLQKDGKMVGVLQSPTRVIRLSADGKSSDFGYGGTPIPGSTTASPRVGILPDGRIIVAATDDATKAVRLFRVWN